MDLEFCSICFIYSKFAAPELIHGSIGWKQYSNMKKEGDNVSRQWEQRDSFHVSYLVNDNGDTIFYLPSTLLAIANGGTPISPILLAAST